MNAYNEAYKNYYDTIRKKVKVENKQEDIISSSQDIYPVKTQKRAGVYSYNNSYNAYYNRGRGKSNSNSKYKVKYIDKFILRVILSGLILVSLYSLKVAKNEQVNKIFEICSKNIRQEVDYSNLIEYVKIKISEFSNEINIDEYLKL